MSIEEQLRNDAESLRELGWFNRAQMMQAGAERINELDERIRRLEEAGDRLAGCTPPTSGRYKAWLKAKEAKL